MRKHARHQEFHSNEVLGSAIATDLGFGRLQQGIHSLHIARPNAVRMPAQCCLIVLASSFLELEKVQVTSAALAVVMELLFASATGWAGCTVGAPDDVQVNPAACDIQCNTLNLPGNREPQGLAKQGFLHLCFFLELACQHNFLTRGVPPETEESHEMQPLCLLDKRRQLLFLM